MKGMLLCGVAVACLATSAKAQEATALEEVIVTAQRRAENLQDVPIAVTAVDAETMTRARIENISNIQSLSPSISFASSAIASSNGNAQIRGLGTTGASRSFEGAVGIFVDGVYRTRAAAALQNFLDIEGLQILRGPQGTLFGKNTSAGAVLLNSKAPSLEGVSGDYRAGVGNHDTRDARLAVNVPISDSVGFRLAGLYSHRDGFFTDPNTGQHLSGDETLAFKGQALVDTGDLQARLIVDYSHSDANCCYATVDLINGPTQPLIEGLTRALGLQPPSPRHKDYEAVANHENRQKVQDYGATLILERDVGLGRLRSTTAARRYIIQQRDVDPDYTGADIIGLDESFDSRFFSQELTLNGEVESFRAKYVLGGFFSTEDLKMKRGLRWGVQGQAYWNAVLGAQGLPPDTVFAAPGTFALEDLGGEARSYAAFLHTNFQLTERLDLILGARYSVERKRGRFHHDFYRPQPNEVFRLLGVQPGPAYDRKNSDEALSGTIGLEYHASENAMLYATYNRGFKAGGVNIDSNGGGTRANNPAVVPGATVLDPRFDPEKVNGYEVGAKIDYLDGRARTNIAAFYNDVSGLQIGQFQGLRFAVLNARSATSYGIEVENSFELARGWRVDLAGTWLPEAKYGRDPRITGPLSGGRFRYTPKFAGNATLNFDQPLNDAYAVSGRLQYQYTGSEFISHASTTTRDSLGIVNANIGIDSVAGHWRVEVWAQNLTNEFAPASSFATPLQAGDENAYVEPPRTFGVTFRGRF